MCLNRDAIATAAPRRPRVRQLVPTTARVAPRNSLKRPPPRPRLLSRTDTPRPDSMPIARAGPLSCGPPGPGLSGPGSSRDPSTPDTGPRRTGLPTPCYEVASSPWPSRAPAPYARPFWETPPQLFLGGASARPAVRKEVERAVAGRRDGRGLAWQVEATCCDPANPWGRVPASGAAGSAEEFPAPSRSLGPRIPDESGETWRRISRIIAAH